MRGDRLLSIVLLLQARGRLTARRLAAELEVSERTIVRDLEALSAAGVPVYAERGRSGGWRLLDGYRSDLSGLTEDEARALFMVAGPAAAELGTAPGVRSALRKLAAALPDRYRAGVDRASRLVLVDTARWGASRPARPLPALPAVQEALAANRRLRFVYRAPGREAAERTVDPAGLVAKAGRWYLLALAGGEPRTYSVARMAEVAILPEAAEVPEGPDLVDRWSAVQGDFDRQRSALVVRVRATGEGAGMIERLIPRSRPRPWPAGDGGGRIGLELRFPGVRAAAGPLAGLPGVTVVEPQAVRAELAAIGRWLVDRYG